LEGSIGAAEDGEDCGPLPLPPSSSLSLPDVLTFSSFRIIFLFMFSYIILLSAATPYVLSLMVSKSYSNISLILLGLPLNLKFYKFDLGLSSAKLIN
jgi:hypothetical protein